MARGICRKADIRVTSGLWPSIRAELNGEFWRPKATLFVVNGTLEPTSEGFGFAADCARGLRDQADGLYISIPIAYPASITQMGKSVQQGRANLVAAIHATPGKIALAGYSQGALVTDFVWRDDILSSSGVLHDRVNDVIAICNFGDPMRCPGIAHGNEHWGIPAPKKLDGFTTGGIAGINDLRPEQTPDFLLSFDNDGDLYGAAPVGDTPWITETGVGHDERLIFEIIQSFSITNVMAIVATVLPELNIAKDATDVIGGLGSLITGVAAESKTIALVQALLNGGLFFIVHAQGPHMGYDAQPAIDFLIKTAKAL